MKFPLDAGVLPGLLEYHVNVDWPRLLVSLLVFAGLLGYMVYSWMKR
ncbi:MAG: hypothetical protein WCA44_00890 [Acidobacteriaceae bacterium]